ncbi:MAG: V-type ATP synthase subunit F [Clostridiaceae bacterium]|jgi:V/A-type H+-transporting ATPase subunit F|nr:V-type ATP synthase subunit F [Clostridiaceae bacterium]
MYRIGIIGDRESVLSFKAVGFDVADTVDSEQAHIAFADFVSKNYAIIFVTEKIAQLISAKIEEHKDNPYPAVIVIPDNRGSNGMGMNAIKKSVERAVGADILFNTDQ